VPPTTTFSRRAGGAIPADQLIDGVVDLVDEIRLEVLLDEGSRLVVPRSPWR
jgi:urease gamma subunit